MCYHDHVVSFHTQLAAPAMRAKLSPSSQPRTPRPWTRVAWQAAWVLLLAGHVPALLSLASSWLDGQAVGLRLLFLIASVAFFILKIADVRWLRLPSDRRAVFALVVACILLHAGILTPQLSGYLPGYEPLQAALVLGSAAVGGALAHSVGPNRLVKVIARCSARLQARYLGQAEALLPPRDLNLASNVRPVRAPPILR
jgi:hypothetical protein